MERIEKYSAARLENGDTIGAIMDDIAAAANSVNKVYIASDRRKEGTGALEDQIDRLAADCADVTDIADLAMALFFQEHPECKDKYSVKTINRDRDALAIMLKSAFKVYSGESTAIKSVFGFLGK